MKSNLTLNIVPLGWYALYVALFVVSFHDTDLVEALYRYVKMTTKGG